MFGETTQSIIKVVWLCFLFRSTFEKAHLKIVKKSFTNKKQKKFQLKDVNNHILKQSNRLTDITQYLQFSLKRIV